MATFKRLPLEIRYIIYRMVLEVEEANAQMVYRSDGRTEPPTRRKGRIYKISPPGVVMVSKEAYEETKNVWRGLVLYKFPTILSLIDVLSSWTEQQVATMRRMQVRDAPPGTALKEFKEVFDCVYSWMMNMNLQVDVSQTLSFFPALQLDELTLWAADESPRMGGDKMEAFVDCMGSCRRLEYYQGEKDQYRCYTRMEYDEEMDDAAAAFEAKGFGRARVELVKVEDLPRRLQGMDSLSTVRRAIVEGANEERIRLGYDEWPQRHSNDEVASYVLDWQKWRDMALARE